MPHKIEFEGLDIECTDHEWDSRLRQFAIENHYDGEFLAQRYPELLVELPEDPDSAVADTLAFIRHRALQKLEKELHMKYRLGGEEFAGDDDYVRIWGVVFATALSAAEAEGGGVVGIEMYYWTILQILRERRGLFTDRLYHGAESRMGQYKDLD